MHPDLPARVLDYFSIPGLTRRLNGRLLARALERRLRACRPDVVLAYRIYPDGYAAVAAGAHLGIPAVVSARGSDLKLIPEAGMARRDTIHAVRHAAAVLCVSRDLVRIAEELGGENRVHLVRNGVDRAIFHPVDQAEARSELGVPLGQLTVVFVGHLIPVKGLPALLRALRILREGGQAWNAVLIGEGGQEVELRATAQQFGIGPWVQFLGARSPREIALWLNACDVFCLPSESEGLPNVVIEALACGRNVVGTNAGGIPELVGTESGFVVPRGDHGALADAIRQSVERAWDRERISRSCPLSWEETAELTLQICQSAADSFRGGTARTRSG